MRLLVDGQVAEARAVYHEWPELAAQQLDLIGHLQLALMELEAVARTECSRNFGGVFPPLEQTITTSSRDDFFPGSDLNHQLSVNAALAVRVFERSIERTAARGSALPPTPPLVAADPPREPSPLTLPPALTDAPPLVDCPSKRPRPDDEAIEPVGFVPLRLLLPCIERVPTPHPPLRSASVASASTPGSSVFDLSNCTLPRTRSLPLCTLSSFPFRADCRDVFVRSGRRNEPYAARFRAKWFHRPAPLVGQLARFPPALLPPCACVPAPSRPPSGPLEVELPAPRSLLPVLSAVSGAFEH